MAIDQVTGGLIKNDAITSAKLADNIELQGAQFKIPVHANDSARDSAIGSPAAGMMIFNTALGAVQQYSGTAWEKMSSPPQVSGLGAGQDGAINTDSTNVVTVNGSGFISGMTVALCAASNNNPITGFTALSHTVVNAQKITVTVNTAVTLGTITSGTGHTNGTYYNVALTDSGAGSGIKATVVVASNAINSVTITDAGTGYGQTDVLGIPLGAGTHGTIGGSGTPTVPITRYYPIAAGTDVFLRITSGGIVVNSQTVKVGADPTFTSPANPLGTTFIDKAVPHTIGSPIQATMTTDGTITYSIVATSSTSTNTYTIDGTTGQVSISTSGGVNHSSGVETDVLTVRAVGSEDPSNQISEFYPVNINICGLPTGGQAIHSLNGYRYHTFTTVGNTTWNSGGITLIEYLIVAGGGGGGRRYGSGGGGAGGVLWTPAGEGIAVTVNTNYTITVGEKGAAADVLNTNGGNGTNSVAFSKTAIGGGGGGGASQGVAGQVGGSGGGGCWDAGSGGNGVGGAGTAGQGNAGSRATPSDGCDSGGAGGGAGGPAYYEGFDGKPEAYNTSNMDYTSHGGPGIQIPWASRAALTGAGGADGLYFAGGGTSAAGTSGWNTAGGRAGIGGGGGGGRGQGNGSAGDGDPQGKGDDSGLALNNGAHGDATNGGNAGANTGGGGGGCGTSTAGQAGHGGTGIVVIRYKI